MLLSLVVIQQYSFARILLTQSIQLSKIVRDSYYYRYAPLGRARAHAQASESGELLCHADTDV